MTRRTKHRNRELCDLHRSLTKRYYAKSRDSALAYVEHAAREILRTHKNLEEFVMGMGTVMFTVVGDPHPHEFLSLHERVYMRSLDKFLDEWDRTFCLTGNPMRFTATGPKRTDW